MEKLEPQTNHSKLKKTLNFLKIINKKFSKNSKKYHNLNSHQLFLIKIKKIKTTKVQLIATKKVIRMLHNKG